MLYETLAILMIALVLVLRGKRRYRRYIRGNYKASQQLGTLAGNTGISTLMDDEVEETCWVSSMLGTWSMQDVTPGTEIGPIGVFVSHGDYTLAEVEEWIENNKTWSTGDMVAQEIAKRKIRQIGVFNLPRDTNSTVTLNDGKLLRTKLGWYLQPGQKLRLTYYNMGDNAFATTDPRGVSIGHVNLFPVS